MNRLILALLCAGVFHAATAAGPLPEWLHYYQMAAERGSAKGQYQLGALYTRSPQVKNPAKGYQWLTIAAKTIGAGNVSGITADQATTLRALAAMGMTKDEVAAAEAAAAAFKAKQ